LAKVFTITEGLENMGALKTGGQGSVYKARRTGEIITAVKLLPTPIHTENEADKNFRDFQNEVTKLKKVNEQPNPNVVKVLNSGITETGSFPFIEMEFIEGPDLEELLKPPHEPIFSIKEVIKVADQLSYALAHCHKVSVKHGDIKSNNVKFNIHTGNYVLLDFGLAVMSDEQRRTSLRHAGAIEFMAPEQNEGRMLFETDVYSFGIILFELLTGTVPFPLKGGGESARNEVRLAHMEVHPPSILSLRRQALPQTWSEEKKEREMQLPDWLLETVYKCLQKKPEDRFENGAALHEYIINNSIRSLGKQEGNRDSINLLQQENSRLLRENEQLQQQLLQLTGNDKRREEEIKFLRSEVLARERTISELNNNAYNYASTPAKKKSKKGLLLVGLVVLAFAAYFLFAMVNNFFSRNDEPKRTSQTQKEVPKEVKKQPIGDYKVVAERAYFHNEPNASTRRSAYMIPSEDIITALDQQNGFLYTEFTNSRGQTSKGWLRREDLMTIDEWNAAQVQTPPEPEVPARLTKIEINQQLQNAKRLLDNGQTAEALNIYNYLAEQDVAEAQFEYGNLALKNRNTEIDCDRANQLIQQASDNGYAPAKRTLGFLYLFGQNKEVMRLNNYTRCDHERNVIRGSRLLMEALAAGDSTAGEILEDANISTTETGN